MLMSKMIVLTMVLIHSHGLLGPSSLSRNSKKAQPPAEQGDERLDRGSGPLLQSRTELGRQAAPFMGEGCPQLPVSPQSLPVQFSRSPFSYETRREGAYG